MTDAVNDLTSVAKTAWWLVLVRAVLAILLGIALLFAPFSGLVAAAIVFGVYTLIDGVTLIVHSITQVRERKPWGALFLLGAIAVLAGVAALFFPAAAGAAGGLVLLWTIVVWAAVLGVTQIGAAGRLGEGHPEKGWNIAGGILTLVLAVVLAILVWVSPAATVLTLVMAVGIYAIAFGILLLVALLRLRRAVRGMGEAVGRLATPASDAKDAATAADATTGASETTTEPQS